eukprot:53111-Chlamydomonas_euryale.AAC.1
MASLLAHAPRLTLASPPTPAAVCSRLVPLDQVCVCNVHVAGGDASGAHLPDVRQLAVYDAMHGPAGAQAHPLGYPVLCFDQRSGHLLDRD